MLIIQSFSNISFWNENKNTIYQLKLFKLNKPIQK